MKHSPVVLSTLHQGLPGFVHGLAPASDDCLWVQLLAHEVLSFLWHTTNMHTSAAGPASFNTCLSEPM